VSVTVWSPFEKLMVPTAVPLDRPNAQNVLLVNVLRLTAWLNVTEIGVRRSMLRAFIDGDVETTVNCPNAPQAQPIPMRNAAGAHRRIAMFMCMTPQNG